MNAWTTPTRLLLGLRFLAALVPIIALLMAPVIAWPDAAAQSASPPACAPVAGTFVDVHGATGTFEGCFAGKRLVLAAVHLGIAGKLSLTLIDQEGRSFATIEGAATLPVSRLVASPDTLSLTLAPSRVIVAGLQAYLDSSDVELDAADVAGVADPTADAGWSCGTVAT